MHQLAHVHRVCVFLINTVVGLGQQLPAQSQALDDQASIFAGLPGKPALGKGYANLVDLSLFVSVMASRGDDHAGPKDSFHVLEVLKDRNGSAEGQWALFVIQEGLFLGSHR